MHDSRETRGPSIRYRVSDRATAAVSHERDSRGRLITFAAIFALVGFDVGESINDLHDGGDVVCQCDGGAVGVSAP